MADEISIEEMMNRMPKAFLPDKAGDVEAVIQYHLTGEEAGDWVVRIGDGKCEVERGETDDASMTLFADSRVYKDIILGKTDAMTAFMQQKVKLKGNFNNALALTKYFKLR
jgi:putative sterol carrier protein